MARRVTLRSVAGLLQGLEGGGVVIDWGENRWIAVDAGERTLEVELAPIAGTRGGLMGFWRRSRIGVWKNLGFPHRLASLGWRMTLRAHGRSIVWAGRGANPRTGYVHVDWKALPGLARLR